MKLTLVNPPRSLYDCDEIAPPLGLLMLAEIARAEGAEASLVDFNLLVHTDRRLQGDDFYEPACARLLAENSDVYGFTSMAVDSHVALHLARLLKGIRPNVIIILGGPHFSSIATEVIRNYSWIDFVIKGEGEEALHTIIRDLQDNHILRLPLVLTSQSISKKSLFPAYDLVDLKSYFAVNPRHCLNYEGGRGCRFKCAFCYSPGHYGNARTFSIESKLEELARLKELGAKHIFFVEDNFINDPRHAFNFCHELRESGLDLTWNCYATLPQLSDELIDAMSEAGCVSVFLGVDAVGAESRKTYGKSFLRSETLLVEKISRCLDSGITPTCAFLLSPPSHPCGVDAEHTLRMALTAGTHGAQVRLNTLTMYNQTNVQNSYTRSLESDETKVGLMLDVPPTVERNSYATSEPQLFPFHSRYVSRNEWVAFVSQVHCLFTLFICYPRTLNELWMTKDISPYEIANRTLAGIDNLFGVAKVRRRDTELLSAITTLEKLTVGSKNSQLLLEAESERLLQANSLWRHQNA